MGFFKKVKKLVRHPKKIIKSPLVIGAALGAITGGLGALVATTPITHGIIMGAGAGTISAVANKGNSKTTSVIKGGALTINSRVGKIDVPVSTTKPLNNKQTTQLTVKTNTENKTPVVTVTLENILTKITQTVINRAHNVSQHKCAEYVRIAIETGLGKTIQRTNSAKDYGESLIKAGYTKLPAKTIIKIGDVLIFPGGVKNPHGHIQIYTKNGWISDYKQKSYYPNALYKKSTPTLYRLTK